MLSTLETVKSFSQLVTRLKLDIYSVAILTDRRDSVVNAGMTADCLLTTYHSILCWVTLDLDRDRNLILNYSLLFI